MKKIFKTFALMLLTVFAFSSCVDVPAPYNLPDKSSNSGNGGSGTNEGTPITCAEAVTLTQALAEGASSPQMYTITGYITELFGNPSKNQQSFWMADTKNGGKVFEAYYANLPEGLEAFVVGTKVKITGKLTKFVNSSGSVICEMKNPMVVILEDGGDGGGGSEEGIAVTCAEAVQLTQALSDNGTSAEIYTITGYITEVVGEVSRNQQTFWMADTKGGGRVFEAYFADLPEGVTAFAVGTKVKITGKLLKFVNANNGNVICEIKNPAVTILADDGGGGGSEEGIAVTCAEAVQLTQALADGGTSSETYTITGYITQVVGSVSKNQQSFWMADTKDGGKVFEAYYANLPNGVSEFTVGKKVKITGKLFKYIDAKNNNAVICEIKNANVEILPDDGGGTPVGDIIPVTCAEAVRLTNALADGGTSTDTYAVTGYITETDGKVSRNQQVFWMADDMQGGKVFQAYWANLSSGVSVFTVGMKVTITGKLVKFIDRNNGNAVICEIKNADVVILENGDGGQGGGGDTPGPGPTPGPGGDDVTELVNGNFEEWVSVSEPLGWKSASSASSANVEQYQGSREGGNYACLIKANTSTNMRLATQEITLAPGTYVFSFYAKAASAPFAQTRIGYVPIKADGSMDAYKYNSAFFDLNNNDWTYVENEFTLTSETKVCLLVMNPKSNADKQYEAQDIVVDDAALVKK